LRPQRFGEQNRAAAGAREIWVVGEDGVPEIHTSDGRVAASALGFDLPRPPKA
jgi:hypothetical protein